MITVVVRPWIRIASFALMVLAGLPAAMAQKSGEQPLIEELPVRKAGTKLGESVSKEVAVPDPEVHPRRVTSFPLPSAKEAEILRILDSFRTVNWGDKPLEDALNELEERTGLEIWIDKRALQEEGMSTEQQVTLVLKKIPLKKCLQLMLEPLALTYVVEDEVLKITTQAKSDESVTTRVYPVSDLFDTPAEAKEFLETIECGLGKTRETDDAPWLAVSSRMKTLTVRDSRVVQERVQELLLALRDAQQHPAAVNDQNSTGRLPVEPPHELVLNFGYIKKLDGTDLLAVLYNNKFVELEDLIPALEEDKREMQLKFGENIIENTNVIIRAQSRISTASVQQLMKKCRVAGFAKFSLRVFYEEE